MAGRPELLTEELMFEICAAIAGGLSTVSACIYCNIDRKTFYNWKKIGKQKPDSIYGAFLENIEVAGVKGEYRSIQKIVNDMSWQSSAWFLERKYPKKWGRKDVLSVKAIPFKDKIKQEENIDTDALSIDECKLINDIYEKNKKNLTATSILLPTDNDDLTKEEDTEEESDSQSVDELFDEQT